MFLTHMAALVVTAFERALETEAHPVVGSKRLWVGPDFPLVEANYPGVWVSFTPDATLRAAGIGHEERALADASGNRRAFTRWLFSGTVEATVIALHRRERDELLDEVLRLIAFADEHPETSALKETMESNQFIAVNAQFGQVRLGGISNSGTTPWGSDDIVYEGTVSFQVEGEFVSDLASERVLVPISAIVIEEPVVDDQTLPDDGRWH